MYNGSDLHQAIEDAKSGSEDAARFLFDFSYPFLKKEALKLLKDESDADDALSQTYMQVFKSLDTLRDPKLFPAWSKRICRNICIRESVKRSKMQEKLQLRPDITDDQAEGMDVIPADFYDETYDPQAQMEASETKELLDSIIGELPQMQRICIMLWQEEYSTREISVMTGLAEGTVKSNIRYAKEKIRTKVLSLEEQGIKLYGMTPVIFFLWVVSEFDRIYIPGTASAAFANNTVALAGTAGAKGSISMAAAASAKAAGIGMGIGKRAALIALCAGIAAGAITGGVLTVKNMRKQDVRSEVLTTVSSAEIEVVLPEAEVVSDVSVFSDAEAAVSERPANMNEHDNTPDDNRREIYEMKHYSFIMPDVWKGKAEAVPYDEENLNIYACGVLIAGIYVKDAEDEGYAGDPGFLRFWTTETNDGKRIELWMPRLTERIPHDEKFPYDDELDATEEEKKLLIELTTGGNVTLEKCREVYEKDDAAGRQEVYVLQDDFYTNAVVSGIILNAL